MQKYSSLHPKTKISILSSCNDEHKTNTSKTNVVTPLVIYDQWIERGKRLFNDTGRDTSNQHYFSTAVW